MDDDLISGVTEPKHPSTSGETSGPYREFSAGPSGADVGEGGPVGPRHLVVVGGGMVAHRLVEALRDRDPAGTWRVTVLAEEPRAPYDRVALTSYFSGRDPADLALGDPALWQDPLVRLRRDTRVTEIDRDARTVTAVRNDTHHTVVEHYDALVLATGSSAAVPPIEGADLPGVFVYRTVDDVAALRGWVAEAAARWKRPVRGAVVGGGLLGLEAAGALQALGAASTVIQFGPRLMPLQVDDGGGEALRRLINAQGVAVRLNTSTTRIRPGRDGKARRMDFADGGRLSSTSSSWPPGCVRATSSRGPRGCPSVRVVAWWWTSPAAPRTRTCGPSARSPASTVPASASSLRGTRWPRWSSIVSSEGPPCSPVRTPRPSSS